MEKKIIFIGGTYKEFTQYCLERVINRNRHVCVLRTQDLLGYCLCEECAVIVWGETGSVTREVSELAAHYIAMGHFGG